MFRNKEAAVEEIAHEAKEIVNTFFLEPPADVKSSDKQEEEISKETLVFYLNKDGRENYNFLVSDRISPETRGDYDELVRDMMSLAPRLQEENVKLIVNLFANYQNIYLNVLAENYNWSIAMQLNNVVNSILYDHISQFTKMFNSPTFRQLTLEDVDAHIRHMESFGTGQQKLTATGLRELQGEMRVFGYKMSEFSGKIYDLVIDHFFTINPHNHVKTLYQLNRAARNVCEALAILYSKIAIQ